MIDEPANTVAEAFRSESATKKRKRNASSALVANHADGGGEQAVSSSSKRKTRKPKEEKRLRRFRSKAPASYLEKLHRATTQRMFVIDRTRSGTYDIPQERIDMAGTTGNIYSITIGPIPSCTCPDNQKGNQCKHIVYVLHNVLKAPEHLQYQLAFLSSELQGIFAAAPARSLSTSASPDAPSNRKEISGDCPVCFTEFEPETEDIVWCKAACGNNIHQTCFEQWGRSQAGKEIRCVYCRTPWHGDEESIKKISKAGGMVNEDGYINVASQLGISGARDYSTYHQYWVSSQGFGNY